MTKAFVLAHPQSADYINDGYFNTDVETIKISCGTTKVSDAMYSEANDFFPTYASWNSALFETSVILTIWEHADELIGNDNIAILHTDIIKNCAADVTWNKLHSLVNDETSVGLVVGQNYNGVLSDFIVPDNVRFFPENDPMFLHAFDPGVYIWDFIKKYDPDIYDFAFSVNPRLIYSHQFLCTRKVFDELGFRLMMIARRLTFNDVSLWMPHVFERLIALYLAKLSTPILTTAFWHSSSSGIHGPGEHNLYGPRGRRFFNIKPRILQ